MYYRSIEFYTDWIDQNKVSPFATIRHYQCLAWQEVRTRISLPRVSWKTRHGSALTIDGKCVDVAKISKMVVDIFQEATAILENDILMGIADETFGGVMKFDNMVDHLRNRDPNYGFLTHPDFCLSLERVVKVFMEDDRTKEKFTYSTKDGIFYHPQFYNKWLHNTERFKQLFYVMFHIVTSLPKRGSEEALMKAFNIVGRERSAFWLADQFAIVGNYSKTSSITGADKLTLQFLPPCLSHLYLRFWKICSSLEKEFIETAIPSTRHTNFNAYMLSSWGESWTSARLSTILRKETKAHLGVELGLNELRHLIPATITHFHVSAATHHSTRKTETEISHQSMGHSGDSGSRLYACTDDSHPTLTADHIFDVSDDAKSLHTFWGFSSNPPIAQSAKDMERWLVSKDQGKVDELGILVAQATQLVSTLIELSMVHNPVLVASPPPLEPMVHNPVLVESPPPSERHIVQPVIRTYLSRHHRSVSSSLVQVQTSLKRAQ